MTVIVTSILANNALDWSVLFYNCHPCKATFGPMFEFWHNVRLHAKSYIDSRSKIGQILLNNALGVVWKILEPSNLQWSNSMIVHFNKRPLLASYLSHGILSAEQPSQTECLMKSTCHVLVLHTQRLTQYNAASPLAISAAAIPQRINLSI